MNFYDSEKMSDLLMNHGYATTDTQEDADLIIVNTCHIREKASEKLFSDLGRIKKIKDKKRLTVAVTGCVAQAEGEQISARAPFVDLITGPQSYHRLPEMLRKIENGKSISPLLEFMPNEKFDNLAFGKNKKGPTSFVSIQEGCDKFCTFCVVPYTRGVETSRSFLEIKDEANELISTGVQEIILLGQNVNAWSNSNGKKMDFADLIYELSLLDLKRIRFTTSHPNDMNHKLISSFRDVEKLQPYLHLPIQSGSNKVLKNMNRNYSSEEYVEIISELKSIRPDIAISGDFIVGFPGETEDDFNKTEEIIKKIGYAHAYSFKYSPRPGTPAGQMENQIDEKIKSERLQRLQDEIKRSMYNYNKRFLNENLQVLVEKETTRGYFSGRSPYLQSIHFQSDSSCIGNIVDIKVLKVNENSLSGEILH